MIARFKDLCIDAAEPVRVARFWAAALGLAMEEQENGDAVLRGPGGVAVMWVNGVPEGKSVKNRVHPDLWVSSIAPLLELGAALQHDHDAFRVLTDPEGNEFCAFPAPGPLAAPAQLYALCTDSADPVAAAAWWAPLLGATAASGPDGAPRYLTGGAGLGDLIWKFVGVDDERVVKNRWHWDVVADAAELVAAGAVVQREPDDTIGWTVLTDPDGNEFCAFAR
ncbi:VOC family protein [Pseudonocardia sp. GCM10023141]|uniref:VOC family protein n=1 Tax=Pseudonocardia sp. GCM10023141 TaxID=3252653 RepID=UPI0036246553